MADPNPLQSGLFQEIEEEVQRKRMEDLWRRYGVYVLVLALVLIGATAGYVSWKNYRAKTESEATAALLSLEAEGGSSAQKFESFERRYEGESQAVLARLYEAGTLRKAGEAAQAVALYDAVAAHSGIDPVFRQFAGLMAVQTLFDKEEPQKLADRLAPLMAADGIWRFSATEYAAHLALKGGDKAKALTLFTGLAVDAAAPPSLKQRASDMVRFLTADPS